VPKPAAPPAQKAGKEEPKKAEDPNVSEKAAVSAPPADELPIVSKEERIEFRDENGRVLNEEEVKALEGKVSFKTRYETRTRVVDAQGNEIREELVDAREVDGPGVAPPHPDVEGRNPETEEVAEAEASELPPTVEAVEDQRKEKSAESQDKEAKPASEAQAATGEN
jgi:dolichyl-phosphate-mannose-protein mannosyltransferase